MTTVGIIGLGIMGNAMAGHLLAAGHDVTGHDLAPAARADLLRLGGRAPGSTAKVAAESAIVITSLPSDRAALDVCGEIAAHGRDGLVVVETSTLDLDTKHRARRTLGRSGVELLDCPLSGTGAQAKNRDVVVYGSGDRAAFDAVRPVLDGFARSVRHVGGFGAGSVMKYIANLLVAAHNVCTAEAFALGVRAGLDRRTMWEVIGDGAGGSVIFTHRGRLMIDDTYLPATAKVSMFVKDVGLVRGLAHRLNLPTPMLDTTAGLYDRAMRLGLGEQDAAALLTFMRTDRLDAPATVTAPPPDKDAAS